jgi:thiosulfate/3-mercaptopyruvate sulfurtransferase
MIRRYQAAALAAFLLLGLARQAGADATLATFADLQKKLGSPELRLLDVRPRADYDRGHAPGAVWVDSKSAQVLAARPGGLLDRDAWQAWVAPLGLGPKTEVFVFDGARQLDSARLWWLLGYLGVENVGLIDGNFPLWASSGRPVSSEATSVEPGTFRVTFHPDRLANREDVAAALKSGSAAIVDARSVGEYTGEKKMSKRGGHIPTACRLEWSDLVDQDGRFLGKAAVEARLSSLGIKPGEPVITHCQGGGRASVDAFALQRLGHPARNFYLGWSDWGNLDATPVVEGSKPGTKP